MNLVVISTAKRPPAALRARCEDSVKAQTLTARHVYIADEHGGYHLENLYHAIHQLDPTDIVVSLDGDDWLLHPRALATVAQAYEHGAWMTWGQYYQFDNGRRVRKGHSHDRRNRRACRSEPWYASHLKTYRAGLFHQIQRESLERLGTWITMCCDMAVMFPLLEMADNRGTFIAEPIYAYDYTDRRARKHDTPGTALNIEERACVAHVRGLPAYPRLENAPW